MSREGWINIEGLEPVKDAFYRYQMPKLRAHMEKTWTVLPFFDKTTNALHRQEQEVLKFFSLTLHTQTKFDQGRACIKGHFSDRDLHLALRRYIEGFVLCGECKKPETAYRIRQSKTILQKCFACGCKTPLDHSHKLCGFILTEYRKTKTSRKDLATQGMANPMAVPTLFPLTLQHEDKPKKQKKKHQKLKTFSPNKQDAESSPAAVGMTDDQAIEEAVLAIRHAMRTTHDRSPARLARCVAREQRGFALAPRDKIRLLIKAAHVNASNLFDETVYEALREVVEGSDMMRGYMEGYLVSCLEERVATVKKAGVQFVAHLKTCYEEDILSEETITAWWKCEAPRTSDCLVSVGIRDRLRRVSAPLIEWLGRPEDEDWASDGC